MDEQARVDKIVLNRIDDFIESHYYRLKVRLEAFEGQIGRRLQARYSHALAHEVLCFQRLGGNHDWAITLAKAGAAIKQNVLIAKSRIGGNADRGGVIRFGYRGR